MKKMLNQKGQLILTLVLVMTVALAIGLSVVQRSLVDVSTATKVEQSSRAFSAAEAGIEKALGGDSSGVNFSDNLSSATVSDSGLIPCIPGAEQCPEKANTRQAPLEYPPLAKEDIAQVWLADYKSSTTPPPPHYTQNALEVYWGDSSEDKAALELTVIYYNGTEFASKKWYLDQTLRNPANSFEQVNTCGGAYLLGSTTYQCKKTLGSLPAGLMLIRARLLYNSGSQPLAFWGVGTCGKNCSLPPQGRNVFSTGVAGETQRRVRLFQINNVVPPYFDYAIFSAGEITK